MGKENYFVGVRFNKDKQLFNKLNKNPLSNSEIIRKSLRQYFVSKEKNQDKNQTFQSDFKENPYNQDLVKSLNSQIEFMRNEISFLHNQNAYLSLPWYKKIVYQLEEHNEKPK